MNLYKNLNDIPFQFRQYERKKNHTKKEDIPSESENIKIEAQNISINTPQNTSEKNPTR